MANLTTGAVTVLKSFNTIDPNSFDLQGLAIDTANSTLYLTARDFNTSSDNAIYSIPFSVSGSGSTATASVGATTTLYSGAGAFQPTDIVVDAQAGIFYTSGTSPYTSPPNVDDQSGNEAGVFEGSLTGGLTLTEVFAVSVGFADANPGHRRRHPGYLFAATVPSGHSPRSDGGRDGHLRRRRFGSDARFGPHD